MYFQLAYVHKPSLTTKRTKISCALLSPVLSGWNRKIVKREQDRNKKSGTGKLGKEWDRKIRKKGQDRKIGKIVWNRVISRREWDRKI